MFLEVCRQVTDWLAEAGPFVASGNGANAMLATIPLDAGDTRPANLASIVDATRDGNVARLRPPELLPALAVVPLPTERLTPHVVVVDVEGDQELAIRLVLSKAQTEQGVRDASYYLRAVLKSLRRFHAATTSPTLRVRNSIYLEACTGLRMAQVWEPMEDAFVVGVVLPTYHVRDQASV